MGRRGIVHLVAVADSMTIPQVVVTASIPTLTMTLFITTTSNGHTGSHHHRAAAAVAKVAETPAPSSFPSLLSLDHYG